MDTNFYSSSAKLEILISSNNLYIPILYNETNNESLFAKKKLIIINQSNDKLLDFIKSFENSSRDIQIVFISGVLEKKSRVRNLFEKDKIE